MEGEEWKAGGEGGRGEGGVGREVEIGYLASKEECGGKGERGGREVGGREVGLGKGSKEAGGLKWRTREKKPFPPFTKSSHPLLPWVPSRPASQVSLGSALTAPPPHLLVSSRGRRLRLTF